MATRETRPPRLPTQREAATDLYMDPSIVSDIVIVRPATSGQLYTILGNLRDLQQLGFGHIVSSEPMEYREMSRKVMEITDPEEALAAAFKLAEIKTPKMDAVARGMMDIEPRAAAAGIQLVGGMPLSFVKDLVDFMDSEDSLDLFPADILEKIRSGKLSPQEHEHETLKGIWQMLSTRRQPDQPSEFERINDLRQRDLKAYVDDIMSRAQVSRVLVLDLAAFDLPLPDDLLRSLREQSGKSLTEIKLDDPAQIGRQLRGEPEPVYPVMPPSPPQIELGPLFPFPETEAAQDALPTTAQPRKKAPDPT
jgi:hypothetical protein